MTFGRFSDAGPVTMILDGEDHFLRPEVLLPDTNDRSQHLYIVRIRHEPGTTNRTHGAGPFA
jgi:hypothetical protein